MKKKSLGIMLTNRCNANCAICGLSCSPKLNSVIDETLMIEVINQAKDIGTFEQIGFTGGEAFLYTDLLIKGSNHAKKLGFKTSVATNGFWGSWSDEKIDAVLSAVTLDHISFSFDAFHNEYISHDAINNAVEAVKRHNIMFDVSIGEIKGKYSADKFFKTMGDFKYFLECKIYPFMRVGRAESLPKEEFFSLSENEKVCSASFHMLVRYDGEIFPCCTAAVPDCMTLGNVKSGTLAELMKTGDCISTYDVIRNSGCFAELMEIAHDKKIISDEDKNLSSCEICRLMFNEQKNYKMLSADIERLHDKLIVENFFQNNVMTNTEISSI